MDAKSAEREVKSAKRKRMLKIVCEMQKEILKMGDSVCGRKQKQSASIE